ncbi:MAG: hypothetical protein AAB552_03565 [Patescibacteria group bacterium]
MRTKIETKKYITVFIITLAIFLGAFAISKRFEERRLGEVRTIENKISLDIIASETQFALLKELSCKAIDHSTAFSEELNNLAQKLTIMENNLGDKNTDVTNLKKYYSLLQVKDYLLVKQINERCRVKPITVIYFYSNAGDCNDCKKEGYVLDSLREEYPELRIYSFDYNLDLSVVKTMKSIYGVKNTLPALIISEDPHYGFQRVEDMERLIPELQRLRAQHEKEALKKTGTSTAE